MSGLSGLPDDRIFICVVRLFKRVILSLYRRSRVWLKRSVNAVSPYNLLQTSLVQKGTPMALKIVYKISCGIDGHKTFVVACIALRIKKASPPMRATVFQST